MGIQVCEFDTVRGMFVLTGLSSFIISDLGLFLGKCHTKNDMAHFFFFS